MTLTEKYADRHPGTVHALRTLEPNPRLPAGAPADLSGACAALADAAVAILTDGPELTAGLRKLREAKDCLVLQAVLDSEA